MHRPQLPEQKRAPLDPRLGSDLWETGPKQRDSEERGKEIQGSQKSWKKRKGKRNVKRQESMDKRVGDEGIREMEAAQEPRRWEAGAATARGLTR